MALDVIYKNRNGTTAEWAASTYILLKGEMGVDTDLNIAKIGDGVHTWKDLNIFNKADTSGFVTLDTEQNITAVKTFGDVTISQSTVQSGDAEMGLTSMNGESFRSWRRDDAYDTLLTFDGIVRTIVDTETGEYVYNQRTVLGFDTPMATAHVYVPNKSGTIALTNDIPTNYVTTDTTQAIDGSKTFTSDIIVGSPKELTFVSIGQNGLGFTTGMGTSTLKSAAPNYEWTLPAKTGTLATTTDIPDTSKFVTLDTEQNITATKTFGAVTISQNTVQVADETAMTSMDTEIFRSWRRDDEYDTILGPEGMTRTVVDMETGEHVPMQNTVLDFDTPMTHATVLIPNKSGTLALTSDIPDTSKFVTIDTTQTISGAKTFNKAVSVSTDSTAGFEITGGGNTWKFNARTDDGPLNIVGTYTYQFPTKTGTIALVSDIPNLITNYVTTDTAQTISGIKQFSGANEAYTNYDTTTIGNIIICSTGGGGDYKTTTLAPDYLEFRYTDVGSSSTNPRVQLKVGAFPTTETSTPQVINLPFKSGTVALTDDIPDLHRVDDSFTTSVWQTSAAAVDTQFGKYYYDCAIGETKHYTIRVTSPYGLTTTTGLDFYPEVKCNNRCVEGSSNNFVRIYSNVKIEGTYDCIYW